MTMLRFSGYARQLDILQNAGWTRENPSTVTINTAATIRDDRLNSQVVNPYLVQRGKIERPLGSFRGFRFSKAVDLDYMGSAEFEFGALPSALRKMQALWPLYKVHRYDAVKINVDGREYVLRVLTWFQGDQIDQYAGKLLTMRQGDIRTKERTEFNFPDGQLPGRTDIWFDLDNLTVFSFDKNFMNHVMENFEASFAYMDAEAAKG